MSNFVRWKAEKEVALTNALTRLGAARRERLTTEDMKVYTDGLRAWPIEAVTAVCEDFARKPVEDFAPRFPTLGSLVQGVKDRLDRERQRKEMSTLRLTEAPVDPQRFADFKRKVFDELARRRSMPAVPAGSWREPGEEG